MNLIDMLHDPAYHRERHVEILLAALGKQVEKIQFARDDIKLQCRPATATWGMSKHEREWGLPVDTSKPIDQRLAAYRSRRRGVGSTTEETIKNIANSFYNGEISIIQHKKEFWIEITFASQIGIPPNMDDLKATISEIIPAHMEVVYMIIWNTQSLLKKYTHRQLAAMTHRQIREDELPHV